MEIFKENKVMKLIDKDALVAEINRILSAFENSDAPVDRLRASTLIGLLSFIDTLEVKEVDLEKELSYEDYKGFFEKYPDLSDDWGFEEAWTFAKHFFKLGLLSTITEEDCKLIWTIGDELPYMSEEDFYKELLKRYKAQKGEEV